MRTLLIVILFCQTAYGQTIEWSNSRKLRGNSVYTHVIGQNSTGIYLLRQKNRLFSKYIILEKYHHQLGFAFSRSLLLQKSRILNAEVNEYGIYLVSVRFNKSSSRNELLVSFYDQNLNPGIYNQRLVDFAPLANYYDKGDFKLSVSKNRKYIAVLHTEMSDKKQRVVSTKVFDNQFNLISSKMVELPYAYNLSQIHDFKLSNDLQGFFILEDVPKKNARKGMLRSTFNLYHYDAKKDNINDYELSDDEHFIQNLKLHIDQLNETINVSGFYSKEQAKKFNGVFNGQFNLHNPDSNKISYTEISKETISSLIGQKNAELDKELANFSLIKAVSTNNNEVVLVAERNSISNEEDVLYVNGTPQALARNIYNFDDLLILALDSSRSIKWHHIIQKNQSSMNDGGYFGSVAMAVTHRSINVLFNDNMRNSGNVMHYTISPEGKVSDKILLHSDTEFVSIIPGESRQISPTTLLIPTVKNKKFALLKISYLH
jgi:hypothetical protein